MALTVSERPGCNLGLLTGLDLFAGAGGLTLGLKQEGVRTIAAIEIDAYAVATFSRHTPGAEIYDVDIQRVDLSKYRRQVDVLYGGPPCQPFSSGGLRQGASDARDMVPWFIKGVEQIQPTAFVMENVPGLVAGDRRTYLDGVLQRLRDLKYNVSWRVLNAADYGVPQKRVRLFIVGMRRGTFCFPKPTHGPGRGNPYVSVADVLPPHQIGEPNPSKVFYAKRPDLRPSPHDGHIFNGGGRAIDRKQPSHTILASAGGNKTHFFDELGLVPEYHRHLREGGAPRVGELPGARRLTVLESSLLQTFPAQMQFAGPRSAQYHQVGNAVPPVLARVLGASLYRQLAGVTAEEAEDYPEQMLLWQ